MNVYVLLTVPQLRYKYETTIKTDENVNIEYVKLLIECFEFDQMEGTMMYQCGWTALVIAEFALKTKTNNRTLRRKISARQARPKLCIGLRVCHIGLVGSSEIHTLASVKMKMMSKMIVMITVTMVWLSK